MCLRFTAEAPSRLYPRTCPPHRSKQDSSHLSLAQRCSEERSSNINAKKEGASEAPSLEWVNVCLESEANRELQSSHARSLFQTSDFAIGSALAIYAAVSAVILAEREDGVIEYVERVKDKLCSEAFRNQKVFRD